MGRFVLMVLLAAAFLLTIAGGLLSVFVGDDKDRQATKDLLTLLIPELLLTLRKAHEELGRWPTGGEWEASTSEHVSRRSYVRAFGSWRRACRTAARLKL